MGKTTWVAADERLSGYARRRRRVGPAVAEAMEGRVMLAGTIYVDVNSPVPVRDGLSWGTAYADLQIALGAAVSGDTIRVADGVYKPTGGTDRTISFQLKNGVGLYGGYAGNGAPNPDARDPAVYPSILSGDIGAADSNSDNSYHVVVGNGLNPTTLIDGFTITGGNANSIDFNSNNTAGGGMYNSSATFRITNCLFVANSASTGGGMCNSSAYGVYNSGSSGELTNCAFVGNTALSGGGMYNYQSSPTLVNCTLTGNTAWDDSYGGYGSALYNMQAFPWLISCTISGNTASNGGSMFNLDSSATLTNCAFNGNSAAQGAGILSVDSPLKLTNCTFSGNSATYGGGGIVIESSATLTNCTFSGNSAAFGGGMVNNSDVSPTITNCIFSANSATTDSQIADGFGTTIITYSDIQGGWAGTGNINIDPRFVRNPLIGADGIWGTVDDDYGDLRLQPLSPCVDAGSNAAVPAGTNTDIAGNARFQEDPATPDTGQGFAPLVDIGAYEAPPGIPAPEIVVEGRGHNIDDGATAPRSADGTDFGSVTQGQTGPIRIYAVRNTGMATLTLGTVSLPDGFTMKEPLAGSLAPGAGDSFMVQLNTANAGTFAGQITISNNDSDEDPFSFSIIGVVAPPVVFAPEIVVEGNGQDIVVGSGTPSLINGTDFGSIPQGQQGPTRTFTVRNTGTADLTIGIVSLPAGFALTEPLNSPIAAGASDTFTVRLETTSVGLSSGEISFSNNDHDANPFNFAIIGNVTPPPAPKIAVEGNGQNIADGESTPETGDGTDFGIVVWSEPRPERTFTVRNTGAATLTLGNVSLPAGFAFAKLPPSLLVAGRSETFTVQLVANAPGTFSGPISITNNDSDENPFDFAITGAVLAPEIAVEGNGHDIAAGDSTPNAADGTDLGNIDQGGRAATATFTVRNTGTSDLTLGDLALPPGYTLFEPLAASIAPGGSDTFTVQLGTSIPSTFSGNVSFSNNDGDENPFTFAITARVGFTANTIAGTLYNDANANGQKDAAEAVLPSRPIFVDVNGNGVPDAGEPAKTTDAFGRYLFVGSFGGGVIVRPGVAAGWRFSNVQIHTPAMAAGGTLVNWDLAVTGKPLVSGVVFNDRNGNGKLDAGETGQAKVRVFIDKDKDGIFDRGETNVLTDSLGQFSFGNLAAGKYSLRAVAPKHRSVIGPRGGAYALKLSAGMIAGGRNFGVK